MRLLVISFGCQMSVADGDEMARPLRERGFTAAEGLEDADAMILNTCTVRQQAEDRAVSHIGRLRRWKEQRPERLLIVAGCAAERLGGWLKSRFPFIDLVVGAKSIEQYPGILEAALNEKFSWARDNEGAWSAQPEPRTASGFVTIMRGCNYSCTYCIVPAVRGPELYRPLDAVLEQTRALAAAGTREVTFLGQTVNSWRDPQGRDFSDLLRAADAVEGLERIRFMSPHPFFMGPRLVSAMAECAKVAPHMHLPAQSGSDRILKAMRRNYTASALLDKVMALRDAVPGIQVSTDFIAGFPGETEADFEATLALAREGDFSAAYCFRFSAREGTEAAGMGGQLPDEVKEERLARLLGLVDAQTRRHLDAMVGRKVRIILDDATDGRTEGCFRARLEEAGRPGDIVDAVVTARTDTALKARALASAPPGVVSLTA